jgi:hypothetical protein
MRGHTKVDDLPSSVADHKPGVQQSEPGGRDDQEVHCGDAVAVVPKKNLPALTLIEIRPALWEVAGNGGETDRNAQFCEFRPDLPRAPAVYFETQSQFKIVLPSPVDRSGSEWETSMNPGRTRIENPQRPIEPGEIGAVVTFPRVGGLHHRYTRELQRAA